MRLRGYLPILVMCAIGIGFLPAAESDGDVGKKLQEILANTPGEDLEPVWEIVEQLAAVGEAAVPALQDAAKDENCSKALAAAGALLRLGAQREGTQAIERLIFSEAAPLARRLEAAAFLGAAGGNYADARLRQWLTKGEALPEILQVELAKSLWRLTHGAEAQEHLRRIAAKGQSKAARAEAALGLAETECYAEVEETIGKLARQPGPLGERANALQNLHVKVRRENAGDDFAGRLVDEVVKKVRRFYAPDETDADEEKQLEPRELATAAVKAMLGSIDPFNDYLDEEDMREFAEQIHANYGGIGAFVGMREGRFTILTPMYDKPAYKAGLRSMDVVVKIDGKDIKDTKLNDIIKMLKGPPKTKVTLSVWRSGWRDPRDFVVERDIIEIPTVQAQILPGQIGYIRLNNFNEGDAQQNPPVLSSAEILARTLKEYQQAGVRGIILDLTNNPGGLLQSAVEVARLFLGGGKLIVYSKGREGVVPRQDFYAAGDPSYTGPLVVMVNDGSASASEIVAGALQEHKRCRLVGQKTFGKGSVQQLIPILSTRGATRIKLTIAKYYLPSGKCIHGPNKPSGGIKPDIEVKEPNLSFAEVDSRWKIRDSHAFDEWLEKHFKEFEKTLRDLAIFDDFNADRYPKFGEIFAEIKQKYPDLPLDREMVRKEMRYAILSYLKNNLGEPWHVDVEENPVLQHAILALGEVMPGGLPDEPLYQAIRQRIEAEQKKLAAAAAASPGQEGKGAPAGEEAENPLPTGVVE